MTQTRVIWPPESNCHIIYQLLGWLEGKTEGVEIDEDTPGLEKAKTKLRRLIETYSTKENEMTF